MKAIYDLRYTEVKEAYNNQWASTELLDNHRRILGDRSIPEIERLLIEQDSKMRILDIGCGMGRTVAYFSSKGFDVVGIDIAKEGLKIFKHSYPEVRVICGSATDLPFKKETFDLVMIMGVLYEVEDVNKINDMLNYTRKMVKNNGILVYVCQYPKDLWKTILSYIPIQRCWFRRLFISDKVDHIPYFARWVISNEETLDLFYRSGWRLTRLLPVNHYYGAANFCYDIFFKKKREMPLAFSVEDNPKEFIRWPGRLIARFSQRWLPMLCPGLVFYQFTKIEE